MLLKALVTQAVDNVTQAVDNVTQAVDNVTQAVDNVTQAVNIESILELMLHMYKL